jgi:hypothetical protein
VTQPDPPYDQLDTALLRLLLIDAILRADAPVLGLLADVMQACGLLPYADEAEEPKTTRERPQKGTLHTLRPPAEDDQ